MSLKNFGKEPFNSMYEKGYVRGFQFPYVDLPHDAPGRFDLEYMQGFEDGKADVDAKLQSLEISAII